MSSQKISCTWGAVLLTIKTLVSFFHVKESHFVLLLITPFFMVNLFEEFVVSEKKTPSNFSIHLLLFIINFNYSENLKQVILNHMAKIISLK